MTQRHECHKVMSPVPCWMFGHRPLHDIQLVVPTLGHMTGHCAAGCYCHWVYPDIGFWSYIDYEVTVLSLSCAPVLSIVFYRSVCVFRVYNAAMPSVPTQHTWSGLCLILNYKYVQSGQTTRCYMNGKNISWRRINYLHSFVPASQVANTEQSFLSPGIMITRCYPKFPRIWIYCANH